MTFTFKSVKNNKYSVSINQDKYSTCYRVELNRLYDECLASTEKAYTYDTIQKANRRYNQLVKEYIYGLT